MRPLTVLLRSFLSRRVLGKKFMVSPTPFRLNSSSASLMLSFQMYRLSFLSLSKASSTLASAISFILFACCSLSSGLWSTLRSVVPLRNWSNFSLSTSSLPSKVLSTFCSFWLTSLDSTLASIDSISTAAAKLAFSSFILACFSCKPFTIPAYSFFSSSRSTVQLLSSFSILEWLLSIKLPSSSIWICNFSVTTFIYFPNLSTASANCPS
mmetsp:Transcript_2287/g.2229  ORF Transcript_2287/g.2229 Transcript_2287/m.2229 type:complete len:210 (-) Transcript_2287:2228-2857(-)